MPTEKGFHALGFALSVFAVVVVQKNVRDQIAYKAQHPDLCGAAAIGAASRPGSARTTGQGRPVHRSIVECAREPRACMLAPVSYTHLDVYKGQQQLFAGETTRLAYGTDEAVEGRDSFLEKREPDWSPFPYYY